jgi:hypothetical protein
MAIFMCVGRLAHSEAMVANLVVGTQYYLLPTDRLSLLVLTMVFMGVSSVRFLCSSSSMQVVKLSVSPLLCKLSFQVWTLFTIFGQKIIVLHSVSSQAHFVNNDNKNNNIIHQLITLAWRRQSRITLTSAVCSFHALVSILVPLLVFIIFNNITCQLQLIIVGW